MLLAGAAAVVGIIVERPAIYAVIALALGLLSFFIFSIRVSCLHRLRLLIFFRLSGEQKTQSCDKDPLMTTVILVTFADSPIFLAMLPAPMANQTERPKATRLQVFVAIFAALLPYVGGGVLVTLTRGLVGLLSRAQRYPSSRLQPLTHYENLLTRSQRKKG